MSVEPDFVYATSYSLNPTYGVGELADFEKNGIAVYVAASTYKKGCAIKDVYQDIRNIGVIFGVENRAEEVIASMRAKIDAVAEKLATVEQRLTVFPFIFGDESRAISTGSLSLAHDLIARAGGVNVFASEEKGNFAASWESVVEANPEVILLDANTGGSGTSDAAQKRVLVESLPELKDVTAVKDGRYIEVPHYIYGFGCIQNADAVELMAKLLYPDLFK